MTLSGHTHGGQVRIGGYSPIVPSRFGNRYAYGAIEEAGRHLVVSGGIGNSMLPVRLGMPPEVTMVRLGGAAGQDTPRREDPDAGHPDGRGAEARQGLTRRALRARPRVQPSEERLQQPPGSPAGFSACTQCPAPGTVANRAAGNSARKRV